MTLKTLSNNTTIRLLQDNAKVPGDPKKSIPLFGVSAGTQVCAKHLNRHIFGFPMKNLIISGQYFQRFYCKKKYICNSAVFSPTAPLQISFVEITLRLTVDISLTENIISDVIAQF